MPDKFSLYLYTSDPTESALNTILSIYKWKNIIGINKVSADETLIFLWSHRNAYVDDLQLKRDMSHIRPFVEHYPNRERAEQDSLDLLRYHYFHIHTGPLENGRPNAILSGGTIPVVYLGLSYQIPLTIQLPIDYPRVAPIVRVVPPENAQLHTSCRYLTPNGNGLVSLDYLSRWTFSNTLVGVASELKNAFSFELPLYQKSPGADSRSPLPYSAGAYVAMPTPSNTAAPSVPYHYGAPSVQMPYPAASYTCTPTPCSVPYPPISTPASYPPVGYPPPTMPHLAGPPHSVPYTDTSSVSSRASSYYGQPPPQSSLYVQDGLLDALRAKTGQKVAEKREALRREVQTLAQHSNVLQSGAAQVDAILAKINNEEHWATASLNSAREHNARMARTLSELESFGDMTAQPDQLVQPSKPLFKQLAESYAEDQAIEDAMYHLSSALRERAVDLDCFLKEIRALARRQFAARQLVMKCRQKAGLPIG